MVALLGREPRSGAGGNLVGALGGHVEDYLVGAIPLSLRPWMADPAPRHGPRAWLRHDLLREGEIPLKQDVKAQAGRQSSGRRRSGPNGTRLQVRVSRPWRTKQNLSFVIRPSRSPCGGGRSGQSAP